MDETRWRRLQALFAEAVDLAEPARAEYIVKACGTDAALADALRSLLQADAATDASKGQDPVPAAVAQAAAQWVAEGRRGLVGERLGPWRITAHLADGGMGAVYLAERADGQYEQVAAVKLLNPALVGDDSRARLAAERQILARLTHPHIARLLDGGTTADGAPYLVMEFVDGEPIDAWCQHQGLGTAARLRLFAQVCRAVDHAHRNLVVHRDLKPSNILVDGSGVPKLLDFGIARLLDAEGVTRSGERLLTPSHAAPEQVTGGPVTTATDVYALGVLLYDLLTGRLPHADTPGNPAALARAIVETEPPRPSDAVSDGSSRRLQAQGERGGRLSPERLARELQGDLDNIVLMALRKEPERRYESAQALAQDIERFLAHRPVQARRDTLMYRGSKFLRRHPVSVPVSAVAIVLAVGGTAAFTWRLADERNRALAAERSAQRTADFTATLLESTQAEEGAARDVTVRDLLDKAAGRIEAELQADPEVAGRLRSALGRAYHSWSAYEQALQMHQSALQLLRSQHTGPHREVARVLSSLSDITHDQGELDASLDWALQAEAMWREVGTPAEQADAQVLLGASYNALRRHADAEPVFRQALGTLRGLDGGRDSEGLANAIFYLAYNLYSTGQLDEALTLYEETVAMRRRMKAPDVRLGELLRHVALVQYERGAFEAAEAAAREALQRLLAAYGDRGHPLLAGAQRLLAGLLIERGQIDEAAQLTAESLATDRRHAGDRHRWTAGSLDWHGLALMHQGRLTEARQMAELSLSIRREVLPADHGDLVRSHLMLGRIALADGQPASAERHLREALRVARVGENLHRAPTEDVLIVLGRAVAMQGRREEGRALTAEGAAMRRIGHHRRQVAEALLGLPPFVATASPEATDLATRLRDELVQRLGPEAPSVFELDRSLGAR
ncbi:MAG: serine/threonine protein kinase [Burkholderiaceae bacterium]|nr:serine/threonine protein kinase [Burkholderiaceae bacterium]